MGGLRLPVKKPKITEDKLGAREIQVIDLMLEGFSKKEIADKMGIKVSTVTTYRTRIKEKTGCSTALEVVKFFKQKPKDENAL